MTYAVSDAISLAASPKPTLQDMTEWADAQETRERAALYGATLVNGYVPASGTRPLAVARRLVDFLARCIEHEDDIATLFRAKAHAAARRRG